MSVKIVTDTGCDLPASQIEEYEIALVPLILRLGERELLDTEASRQELWQHVEAGLPCQTSGPPVGAYEQVYRPLVEAGHEVVCIALTGAHSVTFNSAWTAAQAFPGQVTVIDSRSLSMGYGYQALEAAKLAVAGADVPTIAAAVESIIRRSQIRFFLENLDQVTRGGRLDSLMPMLNRLGRALNIRAILTLNEDGRISLVGPARGRRGAVKRLIQDSLALAPLEWQAVAHTRRLNEAEALAKELSDHSGMARDLIPVVEIGPVLIAHAGEGVLGVISVRSETGP